MMSYPKICCFGSVIASEVSAVFLIFFAWGLLGTVALADGYPFDSESQRVNVPSLRIKLAPEQVQEISAVGIVTFSDDDLRLIRRFYPAVTARADVITATYNDSLEGLSSEDVYCFWVAPDEVAITLNDKRPQEKPPFEPTVNDRFPKDEELKATASRKIRLSPDGKIFFRGQPLTLEQAFALIDEIARFPKPDPNRESAETLRGLDVVVPPSAARGDLYSPDPEQRTPLQIFEALATYGAGKSISVWRAW